MIRLCYILILLNIAFGVNAYSNSLLNLVNTNLSRDSENCGGFNEGHSVIKIQEKLSVTVTRNPILTMNFTFSTIPETQETEADPFVGFEETINDLLFGENLDKKETTVKPVTGPIDEDVDELAHLPSGVIMRAEVFKNKTGVHLPPSEWMHQGHCFLEPTTDFMQTAVNAFAILLEGNLDDVLRLPAEYVLRSSRTIAMMKIAREKLVATWTVVKGDQNPEDITHMTLEHYRPLFKYINGREMSRLNLLNDEILSYVGTHADLDRHQVGVIASRYILLNVDWRLPKYLNLMNNLLCGVPMKFMRTIPENVYLQLSHQLFYHIKACDPLQRRFYLAMMTRTQVLGKSNSWSARDVARLGLLLTEVDGPELSAINPEAMSGISSQVMLEMSPFNLKHLSKVQLQYLSPKPLNILIKKVNDYESELQQINSAVGIKTSLIKLMLCFTVVLKIIT